MDDEYDEGEVFDEMMTSGRGEIRHCLSYTSDVIDNENMNEVSCGAQPSQGPCPSS